MIGADHLRRTAPVLLLCGVAACAPGDAPSDEPAAEAEPEVTAPAAPDPGAPDIWVAELAWGADGRPAVEGLRNATNRPGYDNQPHFFPDGWLWFTRQEGEVTDIWRLDPAGDAVERVTETEESEYSPTPTPDGMGFTVIQVEADGTQRLWRFTLDGTPVEPVFASVAPVGYHAWIDQEQVGMFILGQPASLQIGRAGVDGAERVVERIGRSLNSVPGREAITFPLVGDSGTTIALWAAGDDAFTELVEGRPSAQDHAWGNGLIFQAEGSLLYTFDPARPQEGWVLAADLTEAGIQITRIAVSPDGGRIALVGEVTAAEE